MIRRCCFVLSAVHSAVRLHSSRNLAAPYSSTAAHSINPCYPILSCQPLARLVVQWRPPHPVSSSSMLAERQTTFTTALIKHPIFASFLIPGTPPLPLSPRLCTSSTSSPLLFALTPTSRPPLPQPRPPPLQSQHPACAANAIATAAGCVIGRCAYHRRPATLLSRQLTRAV